MVNVDDSEQWLLSGKCNLCRRNNYCKKSCTAHDNLLLTDVKDCFKVAMQEKFGQTVYKELIEKSIDSIKRKDIF